jgi:hypothetical protein
MDSGSVRFRFIYECQKMEYRALVVDDSSIIPNADEHFTVKSIS